MSAPSTVRKPAVLPAALQSGDRVRLISPASWFDPGKVQTGMDSLRSLGLQPELGANALARYGQYSAGTPEQRLEDLHAAFADDSVKAIICNRGGYGSAEMLPGLDLEPDRTQSENLCSLQRHHQPGNLHPRSNGVGGVSWADGCWRFRAAQWGRCSQLADCAVTGKSLASRG